MSKKQRQRIKVISPENLDTPAKMSQSDIQEEHKQYDKEQYDPLTNVNDKEVLLPKRKTDVVTIRLTPSENQIISHLADENGLSKSAFIRMVVKKALKQEEYHR
jgi:predicted DNA binding CopG/RHH family protein